MHYISIHWSWRQLLRRSQVSISCDWVPILTYNLSYFPILGGYYHILQNRKTSTSTFQRTREGSIKLKWIKLTTELQLHISHSHGEEVISSLGPEEICRRYISRRLIRYSRVIDGCLKFAPTRFMWCFEVWVEKVFLGKASSASGFRIFKSIVAITYSNLRAF